MELINCVTSQVKKQSSAFGESEVKKIRVCCGYSDTDKNPRRLRSRVKFSAVRQESKICACSTQFVSCMSNFRDILNTYAANCITHFQMRVYLTMASG
jgi:aspartate carbamoyltransferase regulatory subunit